MDDRPVSQNTAEAPVSNAPNFNAVPPTEQELQRQKIWSAWHIGGLVGNLYVEEMETNGGDSLDENGRLTVSTSLKGIQSTLAEYGVQSIVLPDLDDFKGDQDTTASGIADDSAHAAIDIHFGTDPLNVYCLGRDLVTLKAYFNALKDYPDRKTNMDRDIKTANQCCGYLHIKERLSTSKQLTETELDKFDDAVRTDIEDLSDKDPS